MSLPASSSRLAAITDFVTWRRAVERILRDHDSRHTRTRAGLVVIYAGGALPAGMLAANGTVVNRAEYPRLFDAIGTTYNTGGETSAQFRLPNVTATPAVGSWVITT